MEQHRGPQIYWTITGRGLSLANLSDGEADFLELVVKRYNPRQDWTRFAAWWNAKFKASGLEVSSVTYRICQDLEARLGINQGKLSLPDYRDFLADLIDGQFGSRHEFCRATGVDPGQLSRVLANRGDLSIKVLQKVLRALSAHLVVETQDVLRSHASVEVASRSIAVALAERAGLASPASGSAPATESVSPTPEDCGKRETLLEHWERSYPSVQDLDSVATRARFVAATKMPLMIADAA